MSGYPYSIEGTVKIGGVLQIELTVTIQNLTKACNGSCITDAYGRYFYDDIQDSTVQAEAGDSIRVCTPSSGDASVTFTASVPEEKVVDFDYILHPHPPPPYSVEGIVVYYKVPQANKVITIRDLTTGTSGTCTTDSEGHYIYDDIRDSVIGSSPGDIINIGTPDGATESFTAVYSEEKVVNFSNIVMASGLWKVVITTSTGTYTFQSSDGILSECSMALQIEGMASFDVALINDAGIYNNYFEVGDQVEIWMDSERGIIGSTKWIKGIIDNVQYSRSDVDNRIVLSGLDYLIKFKQIVVNEIYRGSISYDEIITDLLSKYAPEISSSGVQTTNLSLTTNETLRFSHQSLYDCLDGMRETLGDWVMSISPIGVLCLVPRGNTNPDKELIEFDDLDFSYDSSSMANQITVIGSNDRSRQVQSQWVATASHNNADAYLAFDSDYSTAWSTGIAQDTGQWFKLDLGGVMVISEMFLNNSSYFPDNYPRIYKVEASVDDVSYDEISNVSNNVSPDLITSFQKNYYRYIKISILGANAAIWRIGEINIYTEHAILAQYEDVDSVTNHGLYAEAIKDSELTTKGMCFSRAVAEVTARKEPIVSGTVSINYYFLIKQNELLRLNIPGTPIDLLFAVQKISFSEGMKGTWKESIELKSI